jgi:hypothetical protein
MHTAIQDLSLHFRHFVFHQVLPLRPFTVLRVDIYDPIVYDSACLVTIFTLRRTPAGNPRILAYDGDRNRPNSEPGGEGGLEDKGE